MVWVADGAYRHPVDGDAFVASLEEWKSTVRLDPRVGEFLLPSAPFATVWFEAALADIFDIVLRRAFSGQPVL